MPILNGRGARAELVDLFSTESAPSTGEVEPGSPPGPGLPRWSWLVLAASILLVAGILVQPRWPAHAPSVSAKLRSANSDPARSVTPPAVAVTEAGHRLLGLTAHWDLIGRGPGVVVRIQLASGRITTTRLPADAALAPATLIALPGRVVVQPLADAGGYLITDGVAATRLTGWLARPGPFVPGPGPDQVWVRTNSLQQDAQQMTLFGADGHAGVSVTVPGDGYPSGDGTGHIVYTTRVDNDSYLTSPGRWQVRTSGQLLADGANKVVTIERGRGRYQTVVTDVRTRARRVFASRGFVADPVLAPVAPDGRTAAVLTSDSTATTLALLDLTSGSALGSKMTVADDAASLAWSPDGRWLFVATSGGQVVAVDARTGVVHRLGVSLPPLTQLVLRPSSS